MGIIELVNKHNEWEISVSPSGNQQIQIYIHNTISTIRTGHPSENITNGQGHRGKRKGNSNCHNLFSFIKTLLTNEMDYPSWNTATLNSCFFSRLLTKSISLVHSPPCRPCAWMSVRCTRCASELLCVCTEDQMLVCLIGCVHWFLFFISPLMLCLSLRRKERVHQGMTCIVNVVKRIQVAAKVEATIFSDC